MPDKIRHGIPVAGITSRDRVDAMALAAPLPGIPVVVAPPAAPATVRVIGPEIHAGPVAASQAFRTCRVTLAGIVSRIHAHPCTTDLADRAGMPALPAVGRIGREIHAGAAAAFLHGRPNGTLGPAGSAVEGISLQVVTCGVCYTASRLILAA